jgi:hypothetical protein
MVLDSRMLTMLSHECAIRMGTRRIVLESTELAQVTQATINNTDDPSDLEALAEIKRHLDAATTAAEALSDAVRARSKTN